MAKQFHDVNCRIIDGVAVITLQNPPVNGLGHGVRLGLVEAFSAVRNDPLVQAIVLTGAGRGFSAGGDIREFGTPAAAATPALSLDVHPVIEASAKPVVAALHGFAIGGGLETALVCHYRIAAADTKIGLTELGLGVIPLSGTQRLPRVLGLEAAIELILGGQLQPARQLSAHALFDQIVEGDGQQVLDVAIEFARRCGAGSTTATQPLPLIRHRPLPDSNPQAILAAARQRIGDNPMANEALNAIEAVALSADFDAGMAVARGIYDRLAASDEVRGKRDGFFAARDRSAQ